MTLPAARRDSGATPVDIESLDVKRAATGDQTAFERLYRRHVARVHTLARRMAGPDAADDLTQDVFVRAWDKLGTFRGDSAFSTWLHRLAVNVVLSRRRSEKSDRMWIVEEEASFAAASHAAVHPATRMDLEAAIARLPDGARRVFGLHDVEGWTHEEIAERMGLVPGTSKSQLSRAPSGRRAIA